MRALCDAVLVGAQTVAADNPRLTTRLVPGDSPVRVVLDPSRRLGIDRRVFDDGAAPTLVICEDGLTGSGRHGQADVIGTPGAGRALGASHPVGAAPLAWASPGLHRGGRDQRLRLPARRPTGSAAGDGGTFADRRGAPRGDPACYDIPWRLLRPPCRIFRMGEDILFDCEPGRTRRGGAAGCEAPITRVL